MRISSPATSRAAEYDRNPTHTSRNLGVTPGANARASTQDWAMTVSTGKKAWLDYAFAIVEERANVALTNLANASVTYKKSGGSEHNIFFAILEAGAAGKSDRQALSSRFLMSAGDQVAGYTQVTGANAGCNVSMETSAKMTEFDA